MPIRPRHRTSCPSDWRELSRPIGFSRAGERYERCGRPCARDVLTIHGGRRWDEDANRCRGRGRRIRSRPPHGVTLPGRRTRVVVATSPVAASASAGFAAGFAAASADLGAGAWSDFRARSDGGEDAADGSHEASQGGMLSRRAGVLARLPDAHPQAALRDMTAGQASAQIDATWAAAPAIPS